MLMYLIFGKCEARYNPQIKRLPSDFAGTRLMKSMFLFFCISEGILGMTNWLCLLGTGKFILPSLMQEGVDFWKSEREFIKNAYPIYPKGMARMSVKTDYAVGLTNGDRALLAVWNLSDGERCVKVDLSKYKFSVCEQAYPKKKGGEVLFDGKELTYRFPKGNTARLFLLKKGQ